MKKNRRYFSIGKIKMFLDYLDPIDREIIENQKFEDQEINFLIKNIQENDINYFVDIGSNCGYYSIKLASYNRNLNIKAFEPNEEAYNKFSKTLDVNPIIAKQIELNNFGLSNRSGEYEMISLEKFGYLQTGGSAIIDPNEKQSLNTKIFKSNFKKGDDIINFVNKNLCIKIDVEGHEYHVLEGLKNILTKNKIILQVEIANENLQKVNNLLNNFELRNFNKIMGRANWIYNYYYKNF